MGGDICQKLSSSWKSQIWVGVGWGGGCGGVMMLITSQCHSHTPLQHRWIDGYFHKRSVGVKLTRNQWSLMM